MDDVSWYRPGRVHRIHRSQRGSDYCEDARRDSASTSGHVPVNGLSPARAGQEVAQQVGVVFGQRTRSVDLPTIDSFEILAAMYGVSPADYGRFMDVHGSSGSG